MPKKAAKKLLKKISGSTHKPASNGATINGHQRRPTEKSLSEFLANRNAFLVTWEGREEIEEVRAETRERRQNGKHSVA